MALTYNDISAITTNHIIPDIVDEYYKVSPTFTLIFKGEGQKAFPGGLQIQQPIQYAPLKAGAFAPSGTFDISYIETDTAMTFNVKFYYANVTIRQTDLALNRGADAKMSYVEEKMVNGSQALVQALATDFFADGQGTVTSQIALDGILAGYDDGTNYPSYGGIARAAIGSGANNGINGYYQNVNGVLSLTALQKAYGQASFGTRQPNLLASTQPIYNSIFNKLTPMQRINDATPDLVSYGFNAIRYNNQRLVVDQYCPSGYLFGMNTNFLTAHISDHELFAFGWTGFKELPNSIDASSQIIFGGNIVVSAPRLGFILAGITA